MTPIDPNPQFYTSCRVRGRPKLTQTHGWLIQHGKSTYQYRYNESTVVATPPHFTAHALWQQYTGCFQASEHVLTSPAAPRNFLEVRRLAPRPTTVRGNILRDDNGNVVHDFTEDTFRRLAPPPSYVRGTPVPPTGRLLTFECQMLDLMKELRLWARMRVRKHEEEDWKNKRD